LAFHREDTPGSVDRQVRGRYNRSQSLKKLDGAPANVHNEPKGVYPVPKFLPSKVDDFQREFDELFDEMLIGRWRTPANENEPAMVLEHKDAYEVRVCTGAFKPSELELQVSEDRLTVRARRGAGGIWQRLLTFSDAVATEKVTAKWAKGILTVILPKKSKRPRPERK
jgi:HSP20 family molecular chaperone IbpA